MKHALITICAEIIGGFIGAFVGITLASALSRAGGNVNAARDVWIYVLFTLPVGVLLGRNAARMVVRRLFDSRTSPERE